MAIDTEHLGYADTKPTARKWLSHHWARCGDTCVFTDMQAYVSRSGWPCEVHGKHCTHSPKQPDIAVGGLPCPPWSKQRYKGGSTKATGSAKEHPSYRVVFEFFMDYLDHRQPRMFG